eukprot:4424226-Pleurochrysis_carterae.AAC.2
MSATSQDCRDIGRSKRLHTRYSTSRALERALRCSGTATSEECTKRGAAQPNMHRSSSFHFSRFLKVPGCIGHDAAQTADLK